MIVNQPVTNETTATACDSYIWHGKTYTTSGDYVYTTTAANGCDSLEVLHLTINNTKYAEFTATASDSYIWHGKTYTTSGDYVYTTTASNGCDSVITLHLTINYGDTATFTATACDRYVWHGTEYTTSGTYEYKTTTIHGCDSLEVLQLTINQTKYAEFTATACDSYTWNGDTYTTSGDYVYTTTAANGCDSVITLHLTIMETTYSNHYASICSGSAYEWNGQYYDVSGEYPVVLTNAQGCDSIATLYLTVMPEAIVDTEELILCASELPYTWHGRTLKKAGTYTATEPYTSVGCDSVVYVLDLQTYVLTLPSSVTPPLARAGEPIDISVPNAEIQEHIDQATWYAPNTLITWYIMTNGVWGELTFEPVDASLRDLILKFAVDSDCGRVESRNMKVSVIPTALDDVEVPDEETVTKILINNQVLIIRGGKIYTMMGVEIDIDTNM